MLVQLAADSQTKTRCCKNSIYRTSCAHEEVIQQVKQVEGKDVVLDLFSRGESYRKVIEAAGYIYIPIDLKTLSKDDGTWELLLSSATGEVAAKRQQQQLAQKQDDVAKNI